VPALNSDSGFLGNALRGVPPLVYPLIRLTRISDMVLLMTHAGFCVGRTDWVSEKRNATEGRSLRNPQSINDPPAYRPPIIFVCWITAEDDNRSRKCITVYRNNKWRYRLIYGYRVSVSLLGFPDD